MRRGWLQRAFGCAIASLLELSVASGIALAAETVVYSVQAGKCWLSVEANDAWCTLRVRVHPEYPDCHIEKEAMLSALRAAFSHADPAKLGGTCSSLYIGRLINYPWMSQYLAVAAHNDAAWEARRGKPRTGGINSYVAKLLSRQEITAPAEEALAGAGYRVISVTVEKVLVGRFREVPLYQGKMARAGVLYDAQVWFRPELSGAAERAARRHHPRHGTVRQCEVSPGSSAQR